MPQQTPNSGWSHWIKVNGCLRKSDDPFFFFGEKSLENQMETGQDFFLEDVCVFFFW